MRFIKQAACQGWDLVISTTYASPAGAWLTRIVSDVTQFAQSLAAAGQAGAGGTITQGWDFALRLLQISRAACSLTPMACSR